MKYWLTILLAALLLLTGGCSQAAAEAAVHDGPVLYASIYPLWDFARKVGGERARVELLSAGAADPHDWEPAPGDIASLERADIFVYNGAGLEPWTDSVLAALENDALLVVEASAGLELLPGGSHDHEEDEHDHEEEAHDHAEDHRHGAGDPHVWLSPAGAKVQLRAIADALVRADPEGAAYYEDNYAHWAVELDRLPHREIVVAHQAFGYLCRDFGLEQVAVRGFSPDGEPDPARMAQVISWAAEHEVRVIFFEPSQSARVAEAVAAEVGARVGVLDPLEYLSQERRAAGADYFSVMRENLEALAEALA